jgi:hypothetical protein
MEDNMQTKGQTPRELFQEYKAKTEQALTDYNRFMWVAPLPHVKELEAHFWKVGVLAELYGQVAGKRDGVDYMGQWREGK